MSKFGPFERMGAREAQRRAWREAVARAAEEYVEARTKFLNSALIPIGEPIGSVYRYCMDTMDAWKAEKAKWHAALSAPKPWTRPAKADLGKWICRTACAGDPEPCSACRRWSRVGRAKRRAIRDGQLRGMVELWRAAQRRRR